MQQESNTLVLEDLIDMSLKFITPPNNQTIAKLFLSIQTDMKAKPTDTAHEAMCTFAENLRKADDGKIVLGFCTAMALVNWIVRCPDEAKAKMAELQVIGQELVKSKRELKEMLEAMLHRANSGEVLPPQKTGETVH